MFAAQHDLIQSARLLLAHHAAVNATTMEARDGWSYSLAHDARSPLMYAAASGSLSMIERLLNVRADPYRSIPRALVQSTIYSDSDRWRPIRVSPKRNACKRHSGSFDVCGCEAVQRDPSTVIGLSKGRTR
ncbi:MAG: hypothetical protein ABIQ70_09780 [Dokdonella sp.]